MTHKAYERLGVLPLEPVLEAIRLRLAYEQDPENQPEAPLFVRWLGKKVCVGGLRLQTFAAHGVACALPGCACRGEYFAIERGLDRHGRVFKKTYHLNLYGVTAGGKESIFTHDHTLARSLGGADDLTNTLPMCATCNRWKGTKEYRQLIQERIEAGIHPHTGVRLEEDTQQGLREGGAQLRKLWARFETQARLRGMSVDEYRHACDPRPHRQVVKAPFVTREQSCAGALGLSMEGYQRFSQDRNHYDRAATQARQRLQALGIMKTWPATVPASPWMDVIQRQALERHQPIAVYLGEVEAEAQCRQVPVQARLPRGHNTQAAALHLSPTALSIVLEREPSPIALLATPQPRRPGRR